MVLVILKIWIAMTVFELVTNIAFSNG